MSTHQMQAGLSGIGSMATRSLMTELAVIYARDHDIQVDLTSVGGVDAARCVRAGETFDFVVLAAGVLDRLSQEGHVEAGRIDVARSGMAVAVRTGHRHPDLASEASLRAAVLNAGRVAYSTGPSGDHLLRLLARWELTETLGTRLVLAPPGVPVGTLLARGEADIGFQQLTEFMHLPDIEIVGPLPEPIQLVTVFSASIGTSSTRREATARFLEFLASPGTVDVKRRHGMTPA